jgi:hypothetical protein
MRRNVSQVCAVIGSGAVLAAVVIGTVAGIGGQHPAVLTGSGPTGGSSETVTTAPPSPLVSMAVPAIKGPAPLPKEEQGLPGG